MDGVPAVWYVKSGDDPGFLDLEAMKVVGGHAAVAATGSAKDKQSITERLVRNVLNAYVPGATAGFAIGDGAVVSEPSLSEHVRATFVYEKGADVELSFETQTVKAPDTLTHSNLGEESRFVTARGGKIVTLRDQRRDVAGLAGHEMWILISVPKEEPFVRFTWHFPGVAASSTQPSLDVVGNASAARRGELETIWNSLLRSVRAIPATGR